MFEYSYIKALHIILFVNWFAGLILHASYLFTPEAHLINQNLINL